jgi:hypothetical protein
MVSVSGGGAGVDAFGTGGAVFGLDFPAQPTADNEAPRTTPAAIRDQVVVRMAVVLNG